MSTCRQLFSSSSFMGCRRWMGNAFRFDPVVRSSGVLQNKLIIQANLTPSFRSSSDDKKGEYSDRLKHFRSKGIEKIGNALGTWEISRTIKEKPDTFDSQSLLSTSSKLSELSFGELLDLLNTAVSEKWTQITIEILENLLEKDFKSNELPDLTKALKLFSDLSPGVLHHKYIGKIVESLLKEVTSRIDQIKDSELDSVILICSVGMAGGRIQFYNEDLLEKAVARSLEIDGWNRRSVKHQDNIGDQNVDLQGDCVESTVSDPSYTHKTNSFLNTFDSHVLLSSFKLFLLECPGSNPAFGQVMNLTRKRLREQELRHVLIISHLLRVNWMGSKLSPLETLRNVLASAITESNSSSRLIKLPCFEQLHSPKIMRMWKRSRCTTTAQIPKVSLGKNFKDFEWTTPRQTSRGLDDSSQNHLPPIPVVVNLCELILWLLLFCLPFLQFVFLLLLPRRNAIANDPPYLLSNNNVVDSESINM